MKLRSTTSSVYTALTLIVGGALSGLVLGFLFYTFFLPPWKVTPISSPHAELTEIFLLIIPLQITQPMTRYMSKKSQVQFFNITTIAGKL
jgi:hypothetical protein